MLKFSFNKVSLLKNEANMLKFLQKFSERQLATAATQAKEDPKGGTKENMSFMMNLFRGVVQPAQVFPYPDALTEEMTEHLKMLIDPTQKFFEEVNNAEKNDDASAIEPHTLQGLRDFGAFALQVPQEYGGMGITNSQYARITEIVGGHDLGVAVTLGAHQSIGFKGILLFGNPEQKAKYLPRVATGKEFAAFCLTEPSSGSDAGSIRSRATLSPDGKHYILNGSKIWISNGGIADIMTVFAQTPVKDPKTGKEIDKVTAFIVERSFGGVTSGPPEPKMGIKCSNTTDIFYDNVPIPVENVLGGVGEGFKVAMNILNNGRFGMAAALSGTMRAVTKKAVEHATTRIQFGRRIDSYGTIQEKLARMAMLHYITESLAYCISGNMDSGSTDYHLEAAISKVFASDSAWTVTDEAIQILGGMGFMKGTGLEKVMRDLRVFKIFEGTNDILRLFVALTGIQYAGSQLKELQMAFRQPTAHLSLIMEEVTKRGLRTVGLGSTPSLSHLVHPSLSPSAALVAKSITQFGPAVESLLMKFGRGIVEEQFLLNRVANAAIDIYTMSVALSRATRSIQKNLPSAEHEALMTKVWCSEGSMRVSNNLGALRSPHHAANFKNMSQIAKNICENGGFVQPNPLNV
ncbi:unnamed protein product [Nezara viridula]|uniref:Very long-chain specific acyl-CoA dehydrogenase, mitochondrial n=1 Tax=Nezara viridula TaxID=85310 RepID=A0A9P0HNC6_NEZVI|nr:unnamed protein product [Nezara viridula]